MADAMLRFQAGERVTIPKPDNAEMGRHVVNYTRWVKHDLKPGEILLPERKVPLLYKRDDTGTVDVTIFGMPHRLVIRDLKYGAGVSVDAHENDQLALYAESVIKEWEANREEYVPSEMPVTMEIFQPRDMHNSEPIRTWTLKRWELANFVRRHVEAVAMIRQGRVAFAPSDKACRWCPAKGICKAFATQGLSILNGEETSVDQVLDRPFELPNPKILTREQRERVIAGRKLLEAWLEAVEDQEVHEMMCGEPPGAYKLVEGRVHRQWANEEKVLELLEITHDAQEFLTEPMLKSPKQIEDLMGGELPYYLSQLVYRPAGKPTLAPVSDKRPALDYNPTADFVDLDPPGSDVV